MISQQSAELLQRLTQSGADLASGARSKAAELAGKFEAD